jgi:hypothetical protein
MNTKDKKAEVLPSTNAVENITIQQLPSELQQKINKALDDYKSGNYITHEEMKRKL